MKAAVVEHAKTILGEDGEPVYKRLQEAVQDFQQKAVDGANKKIEDIEQRLNQIIAAIFSDHEVEYLQSTEAGDKSITLFPVAGRLLLGPKEGHKSGMEYQGSGTRRTLLWAALRILSEEKSSTGRPHVLLSPFLRGRCSGKISRNWKRHYRSNLLDGVAMNFEILCRAVNDKKCVTAVYKDQQRLFAPHCVGTGKNNEMNVFGYQYGGASSGKLPNWRCFRVDELDNVEINSDEWMTSSDHSKPNSCVVVAHAQVSF